MSFRAIALASAVAFAFSGVSALAQNATVFEGARLIIGDGTVVENGVLLVEGNRITQAGAAASVKAPSGATRVNLAGKTVMPAIVDTHMHLSATKEAATLDLVRRAYYGVGTAASFGLDTPEVMSLRGQNIPGAAGYITAGRGITMPEEGRSTVPHWVKSPDDGRKAVQEEAAKKVDLIKIWVDDRDGKYQKMPPDIYGAVIDEARKAGLGVTAHIYALEDAKGLVRAGVGSLAHSIRDADADQEYLTLLKQHPNVVQISNLANPGIKEDLTWLKASLPAADYEKLEKANVDQPADRRATFQTHARNLVKTRDAGNKITLGTDGNTPYGPHLEIADMVTAGLTPMQAIVASTRDGADFLKVNTGTLQAGKSADFLVLDANPAEDIRNTRKIAAVYLRGQQVDRKASPMMTGQP